MEHLGCCVLVNGRSAYVIYIMCINVIQLRFSLFLITVPSSSIDSVFHHEHSITEFTAMPYKTPTLPPISFSILILLGILTEAYNLNVQLFTAIPSNRSVNPL